MVVNPTSAHGATLSRWKKLLPLATEILGPLESRCTQYPGHATRIVRQALRSGINRVIAVGGDGTNNEVVNGFFDDLQPINPHAEFGILPSGTGGDLRRTLGIEKLSRSALSALASSRIIEADIGLARFVDPEGRTTHRVFINVLSFGLSGLVVDRVNRSSKILGGTLSFVLGSLKAIIRSRSTLLKLKILDARDDVIFDSSVQAYTAAICNGQFFGGGMQVAPNANIDDGLFDLTIIGKMSKARLCIKIPTIYSGSHVKLPEVSLFKGFHIEADSDNPVLVEMDGELVGRLPVSVKLAPRSIRLRVPS